MKHVFFLIVFIFISLCTHSSSFVHNFNGKSFIQASPTLKTNRLIGNQHGKFQSEVSKLNAEEVRHLLKFQLNQATSDSTTEEIAAHWAKHFQKNTDTKYQIISGY